MLQVLKRPSVRKLLLSHTESDTVIVQLLNYWYTVTPGGALGYFLGGYVPPGTPNWHPVLKKISPKIDTPF